jgi:hypothetical protein
MQLKVGQRYKRTDSEHISIIEVTFVGNSNRGIVCQNIKDNQFIVGFSAGFGFVDNKYVKYEYLEGQDKENNNG